MANWGPNFHRELAELFLEEWSRGVRRTGLAIARRGSDHLRVDSRLHLAGTGFADGLGAAQRELLEGLLTEKRVAKNANRRGFNTRVVRNAIAKLETLGLVTSWRERFGKRELWCAKVTLRGWQVLLEKRRAR